MCVSYFPLFSSKIRTFRDLSNDMDDESNSGDDEHENLYAGGEKS
jgi:UBX domain-containing protein 1